MSHRAIRCLIGDATKSLDDKIQFGFGRFSDFNDVRHVHWPVVWLNPIRANTTIPDNGAGITKTWDIWLYILDLDKSGSGPKEFQVILDELDFIADSLIRRIDEWYRTGTDIVGSITITSVNHEPKIKTAAEICTGWELRFQLETSDDFDYCRDPDNIALYNGRYRDNQDTE